jgi:hypothetical protein
LQEQLYPRTRGGPKTERLHASHQPSPIHPIIGFLKIQKHQAPRLLHPLQVQNLFYMEHSVVPNPPAWQEPRLRDIYDSVQGISHALHHGTSKQLVVTAQQRDGPIRGHTVNSQALAFVEQSDEALLHGPGQRALLEGLLRHLSELLLQVVPEEPVELVRQAIMPRPRAPRQRAKRLSQLIN